jgi:TolB protein
MRMRTCLLVLAIAIVPLAAAAQDRQRIDITGAGSKKYRAAILRFAPVSASAQAGVEGLRTSIEEALQFSGLFDTISQQAFLDPVQSPPLSPEPRVTCPNWRQIGTDALVLGELDVQAAKVRAEIRALDVSRGCQVILRETYTVDTKERRRVGKQIADDVVGAFTGVPGIADSEMALVSDRTGAKEIWVMDADADDLRRATNNKTINTFPNWAPDGATIVYTSYQRASRPKLYLLTRGRSSPGQILKELPAQIYRGVFDPSGAKLAVVRDSEGSSEIYTVGKGGGGTTRLTKNGAIDVGPTWSPDGRRLAFASDRVGAPQIYVMNADGSDQKRITFNGSYNSNPSWSPDGKWIAYESRVGGQMDIWLIDPSGGANVPLLEHPRSDEAPTWAPDSRTLAFSSNRRGRMDIYAVDLNGDNLRQITNGPGNNTNPSWGPRRRR